MIPALHVMALPAEASNRSGQPAGQRFPMSKAGSHPPFQRVMRQQKYRAAQRRSDLEVCGGLAE